MHQKINKDENMPQQKQSNICAKLCLNLEKFCPFFEKLKKITSENTEALLTKSIPNWLAFIIEVIPVVLSFAIMVLTWPRGDNAFRYDPNDPYQNVVFYLSVGINWMSAFILWVSFADKFVNRDGASKEDIAKRFKWSLVLGFICAVAIFGTAWWMQSHKSPCPTPPNPLYAPCLGVLAIP